MLTWAAAFFGMISRFHVKTPSFILVLSAYPDNINNSGLAKIKYIIIQMPCQAIYIRVLRVLQVLINLANYSVHREKHTFHYRLTKQKTRHFSWLSSFFPFVQTAPTSSILLKKRSYCDIIWIHYYLYIMRLFIFWKIYRLHIDFIY